MNSGNIESLNYSSIVPTKEDYNSGNVTRSEVRMIKGEKGGIGYANAGAGKGVGGIDGNLNRKKVNVLNEFKATLAETERFTSMLNKPKAKGFYEKLKEVKNSNAACDYNDNDHKDITEEASILSIGVTQGQTIEEDDPYARLKISNDILLKTNLDLRNINKILHDEIEAYKHSSSYQSPFSQYDLNLNEFISNIKQALNTSQISNQELQEIVQQSHKRTEEISKANNELIHHYDTIKADFENKTREACEFKTAISNRDTQINQLNQTIKLLQHKVEGLEGVIVDNDKQINYQKTINSSYNKYKEDNDDMLGSFKQTIENLQKGNVRHLEKISQLQGQIDQMQSKLISNEVIIDKGVNDLKLKDNDVMKHKAQINELNVTIRDLKETIGDKTNAIRLLHGEKDKLNSQIESLNLFIEDRDKTISTLKTSLGILTKTFENDMTVLKANPNDSVPLQVQLNEKIDQLTDYIKEKEGIIEELTLENNALIKGRSESQKEIDEYVNQFEQSQYEYQLLYQKYKEQTGLIDTLKAEFLNKRNDKELMELIKANEDIMKKLKTIQDENKTKTQELNDLKKNYTKISKELYEVQCLNTSLEMANNQYLLSSPNKAEEYNQIDKNRVPSKESDRYEENIQDYSSQRHLDSLTQFNSIPVHSLIHSQQFLCEINDLEESSSTSRIEQNPNPLQYNTISSTRPKPKTRSNCFHYTMIDSSSIISFNLQSNTFARIPYQDLTSNNNSSSKFLKTYDKTSSITVNFPNGLFIINSHLIFFFNPLTKTIEQIAKLKISHKKTSAIYFNDELYIISGEKTHVCEKLTFNIDLHSPNAPITSDVKLPDINFIRTNSGLCFLNDKHLIALFGNCEKQGSIERLDLSYPKSSWEVIDYYFNGNKSMTSIWLSHFICFSHDGIIIITGGMSNQGICNSTLYHIDLNARRIEEIGDSQCYSLFNEACMEIENSVYLNYDYDGNVHVFDKGFDYYKVFNLNYTNQY